MGLSQVNENLAINAPVALTNAVGTTPTAVLPSQPYQKRLDAILITSTDTADHKLSFTIVIGANSYAVFSVDVPAGSGTAGAKPIEVFAALGLTNLPGLVLAASVAFYVTADAAVTSGLQITVTALGGTL